MYAGLPNSSDDKSDIKGLRKEVKEKDAQIAQLQSDLANEKDNAKLQVEAAVQKVRAETAKAATEAFERGCQFAKELMK